MLTVTVVTLNEESNLRRCLASVGDLVSEMIVVDSGSTDGTKAVAEEFGATNIIIGKTGSSRIRTQLFGSVANTLIQVAEQPVTVVP